MRAVQPLAYQGQDVVLMQLLDPVELQPAWHESALFEDMESGADDRSVAGLHAAPAIASASQAHIAALRRRRCAPAPITCCSSPTSRWTSALRRLPDVPAEAQIAMWLAPLVPAGTAGPRPAAVAAPLRAQDRHRSSLRLADVPGASEVRRSRRHELRYWLLLALRLLLLAAAGAGLRRSAVARARCQ